MKSRKKKEALRKEIREASKAFWGKKCRNKPIHYIWNDFYYWIARCAWEILHDKIGEYEYWYCSKTGQLNKYRAMKISW